MKKLLALLFTVNILFATTTQNEIFLKKIKTLNNLEHNVSQKILKEKMDNLVGYYLKSDDIFSKEALALAKKNHYNRLRYNAFFRRLDTYFSYLEKHNSKKENRKMLNILLEKALKDSTMLMKNSDNFVDYQVSINMIKKIYGSFDNLKNYKEIFLKYPVPRSELFFEKLELDKNNIFNMWKDREQEELAGLRKMIMKKIEDDVVLKYTAILDIHYTKMKKAILDGSEKAIKEYEDYISNIEKIDITLGEQTKVISTIYKLKYLETSKIENTNLAKISNTIVTTLVKFLPTYLNTYREAYKEHQALDKMQGVLLK